MSGELPPEFNGIFHLPNQGDAFNLQFNSNGTFSWNVWGCDYGNGGNGIWRKSGNNLILEPIENRELKWVGKGIMFPVKQVEFSSQNNVIVAQITPFKESHNTILNNPQTWELGKVCAQCGGLLGPSGPAKLCSEMQEDLSCNSLQ